MKVVGFNKREYKIPLHKYVTHRLDDRAKSAHHLSARTVLQEFFKGYSLLEEVKLPGSRNKSLKSALFLDFFVPDVRLGVEVHGRQHYEYCQFFHKSKAGFRESIKRDNLKDEWCELNDISLIVFKYSEDISTWRHQLEQF